MTAPAVIRQKKDESLDSLLEALNNLGIEEEDLQALEQAGTSVGTAGARPLERDPLGNQAYTYRLLAVLAQKVVAQQARISKLEAQASSKSKTKAA